MAVEVQKSAFVTDSHFWLTQDDKLTHVKAASNAGTSERLHSTELLTGGHETGHLLLGELNLATAEGREVDVGDLVLLGGLGRHGCGVVGGCVRKRCKGRWRRRRKRREGTMGSEKCNYVYARRGARLWEFFSQASQARRQLRSLSAKSHLPTKGRSTLPLRAPRLNPTAFLSPILFIFAVCMIV